MEVLFLSAWFPFPVDNGSKMRIFNLLRVLARRHRISLISAGAPALNPGELATLCQQITTVVWQPRPASGWRRFASMALPRPDWSIVQPDPAFAHAVAHHIALSPPDVVVASEVGTGVYAAQLRDSPALLDDLEIGAYRPLAEYSRTRRWRSALYWWKLRRAVRLLLLRFAACTVVSPVERHLVGAIAPRTCRVECIPNCVDYGGYAGIREVAEADSLVFLGSLRFRANWEAMDWFLRSVFPVVLQQRPSACLRITGMPGSIPVSGSHQPRLSFTGWLDDVRPSVARSWCSVVPLRGGGGTRLKILEAMALGTPVVSTRKGAEGLDVVHGEHLLLADDPTSFASEVVRLLGDAELRAHLAANGRRLVQEKYDWAVVGPQFDALCERVAKGV